MSPFNRYNLFTIADISLYAYTHIADEGQIDLNNEIDLSNEFDLSNYPAINPWLARIQAEPK